MDVEAVGRRSGIDERIAEGAAALLDGVLLRPEAHERGCLRILSLSQSKARTEVAGGHLERVHLGRREGKAAPLGAEHHTRSARIGRKLESDDAGIVELDGGARRRRSLTGSVD